MHRALLIVHFLVFFKISLWFFCLWRTLSFHQLFFWQHCYSKKKINPVLNSHCFRRTQINNKKCNQNTKKRRTKSNFSMIFFLKIRVSLHHRCSPVFNTFALKRSPSSFMTRCVLCRSFTFCKCEAEHHISRS